MLPAVTRSPDPADRRESADTPAPPGESLRDLARAHGVATSFDGWRGGRSEASTETLTAVLGALGVDASSDDAVEAALQEAADGPWRDVLGPVVVVTDAGGTAAVHVPDGEAAALSAVLDDGTVLELALTDDRADPREVDGVRVGRAQFAVPAGLPLGYHELRAVTGPSSDVSTSLLVVTRPASSCPLRSATPASAGG